MRFPTPKMDIWLACASIVLLGASTVIGTDPTHHLEIWAFWGGVGGFGLLILWHLLARGVNLILGASAESTVGIDNRGGTYIGGDNSGTQQVFHGPVTLTGTTPSPKYLDREFVPSTLTLDRLLASFNDKTDLQAQALCRPFLGKWMRVRGKVSSVSEFSRELFSVYVRPESGPEYIAPSILCLFREDWETSLHALSKNDQITVIGILQSASFLAMTLTSCEIEDEQ